MPAGRATGRVSVLLERLRRPGPQDEVLAPARQAKARRVYRRSFFEYIPTVRRRFLVAIPMLLVAADTLGEPGHPGFDLCRYSEPEYTPQELAKVRGYQACIRSRAEPAERNAAAEKCRRMTLAAAGNRLVECGSAPEWRRYPLEHAISECSEKTHPHHGKPGRYSCQELMRRYPEILPAIDACREIAPAFERDQRKSRWSKRWCRLIHSKGYALERECRKTVRVVPPQVIAPPSP